MALRGLIVTSKRQIPMITVTSVKIPNIAFKISAHAPDSPTTFHNNSEEFFSK